jgi:hypothetical protein
MPSLWNSGEHTLFRSLERVGGGECLAHRLARLGIEQAILLPPAPGLVGHAPRHRQARTASLITPALLPPPDRPLLGSCMISGKTKYRYSSLMPPSDVRASL